MTPISSSRSSPSFAWPPGAVRLRCVVCRMVAGTALAALLSCTGAAGSAASAIPDTPAGRALHEWLGAYNAGDSARLRRYVQRYEPAMSVHAQLVLRQQTGPWQIASIERSESRYLEVVLQSRADSTAGLVSLIEYAVIDVTDGATPRATSTLAYVGHGERLRLPRIGAEERAMAIDSVIAKTVRNHVSVAMAHEIADSLSARRARGAYDGYGTTVSFAARLDHDLREVGHDRQLGIEYASRLPPPLPTPTPPAILHCGIGRTLLLDGRVGYLQLYAFGIPVWECSHEISDALSAVADAGALILDLRDATEDLPDSRGRMAYVASYLVAGCTRLSDVVDRRTAMTEELWTTDDLPGRRFGGGRPLYILTSGRTFSAAEELAYDLQSHGRATIVGERTAGAAQVIGQGPIGDHLLVRVPIARTVNPVTRTNWSWRGVRPDVPVAEGEALATARQLAREGRTPHSPAVSPGPSGPPPVARSPGGPGSPGLMRGVRFSIDTLARYAETRGMLSRVAGTVEFANGRGRLDVRAVSTAPAIAVNGVPITMPLATAGDYYLFDNAGFVLVRPAARTFSSFALARADFNHTGELLRGAFMMRRTPLQVDTLTARDASANRQHAPIVVQWHMQPRNGPVPASGNGNLYARGWLEIADAPAVEAGVARWFEVAAALATRAEGLPVLAPGDLEVTSVAGLRRAGAHGPSVFIGEDLRPSGLAIADVDPARLVVPAGYVETRWPGFEHVPAMSALSPASSARWRALEDTASQRARSACKQAWLAEHVGGLSADTATTTRLSRSTGLR